MKRRRTWLVLWLLAMAVSALLAGGGCARGGAPSVRYHCPMHPTYVSDRPGDCPICGMRLMPIEPASPPAQAAPAQVPSAGARQPGDAGVVAAIPGLAEVAPGAEALRLAGVLTAPVTRERLTRTIRATAQVVSDETRVRRVQVRAGGWVERLFVDFTGQRVRAGEPLLSLYSPDLLATQEEYVRARQAADRFAASDQPEVRRGGEDLVSAARRRLELLDVPAAFIAELERTGTPRRDVTLTAPVSGFVTAKAVFAGQRVEPGMELFTVTDLGTVWVEAQLYEAEAPLVAVGQAATLGLPYDPALAREGRVTFVSPTIEIATRTLAVRLEFANADLRLKPGMYAVVQLHVDLGEQLVVPDDAVMDTGERQYVFVAGAESSFSPRAVKVGWRGDGRAQILAGLAVGEQVATRANFLLDSESRLRAALAEAPTSSGGAGPAPPGDRP